MGLNDLKQGNVVKRGDLYKEGICTCAKCGQDVINCIDCVNVDENPNCTALHLTCEIELMKDGRGGP